MYDTQINSLLDTYNANTLYEMMLATPTFGKGTKKPAKQAMLDLMREKYFTPERIVTSLDKLNKTERDVLNRLLLYGEVEVASKNFQRELERAKLVEAPPTTKSQFNHSGVSYSNDTYNGTPHKPISKVYADVIARLTYYGLVFSREPVSDYSASFKVQFHPAALVFVPDFVRQHLPQPEPLPETASDWSPASSKTGDPTALLRELYLYWDFVRRTPLELLQSGMVGKRPLRALNTVMINADTKVDDPGKEEETDKLYLYRLILQELKLIKVEQNRLVAKDVKSPADFWMLDSDAQISAFLRAWLTLPVVIELTPQTRVFYPQGKAARTLFIDLLSKRRPQWHEPVDWVEFLSNKDRAFLYPRRTQLESRNNYQAYYELGYYRDTAQLIQLHNQGELEFVRFVFERILFPFGLVELGDEGDEKKPWVAARLTAGGVKVLKLFSVGESRTLFDPPVEYVVQTPSAPSAPSTPNEGRIVLQPNFQILAMGPVSLAALATLDRFAERRKADATVFEYHLTRQSVYDGLQRGLTSTEIETFLRTVSNAEVPQNVRRSLQEWGAHHERIVFRSGVTLLQAASPELLAKLSNDEHVRAHLQRSLTPEVGLVTQIQTTPLIHALIQVGLLPAISNDQPAAANHSVTMSEAGVIQPIHAVPSLHLSGRLARFAEKTDGGWRVTQASVRKAGGNRQKISELLSEMAALQRGELPENLIDAVKKWGAYYGSATVDTFTLVEFSDRNTLNELLKHPKLKEILSPFKAGERTIAAIPTKQQREVEKVLKELGVELPLLK